MKLKLRHLLRGAGCQSGGCRTGSLRALAALLILSSFTLYPSSFLRAAVSETPEEFHANGDFNGDGRTDIVIVDKVSGSYRVGYGQANGTNVWADTRASGVEYVTGFSVGRLLNLTRDALAFTSPDANRINVFDASVVNSSGQPTNVFIGALGPSRTVAVDIGGPGATGHDDLYTASIANALVAPYHATLTRANAFAQLNDIPLTAEVVAAERIKLKTNSVNSTIGILFRTQPNLLFSAQYTTNIQPVVATFANNLPDVNAFLFANFNNTAFNQFLFYKGGASNLVLRPVFEPVAGFLQFAAGTTFPFGEALRQVVAIPGPADVRLLIIFGQGETAGVYSFDGTNAPVLVESFAADPGETFTGASAVGGGNFTLMSGVDGRSTKFQTWNRSGNGYVKGASGELPGLNPLALHANVFLFQHKPFVHPSPLLLRTLNAADWSSGISLTSPVGQVSASAEKFRNSTQGLGNVASKNLGAAPPNAAFGLPNQIAESFSLLSFSPAIGNEVVEVSISPAPGHYPLGISFTLSVPTNAGAATIRYRLSNNESWQTFAPGSKVPLFKDTMVSYYAQLANNLKSTIRTATYTFDTPPSDLDTDGDGVPDFVELGLGGGEESLHSKDTDGDGYSDLAEILDGTTNAHPYNASITPTNNPRADELSGFDWYVLPRALAGHVPAMVYAQTGTVASAYDLHGGLLHTTAALPFFDLTYAEFPKLFADIGQRLYVAATEPHFDIKTNGLAAWDGTNDTRVGREMLRMVPVPAGGSGLEVNYTYGGGNLGTEASNWVAAARAAQNAIEPMFVVSDFTYFDTLAALLVERKVGELLLTRGLIYDTNKITLFPFRANDAGRINPPQTNLLSLETNLFLTGTNVPDPNFPAHKLVDLYNAFSLSVTSPATAQVAKLVELAGEIYRISAVSNNVAPGQFPSPLDTLRAFLETGVLHSNYLAATTLAPADLSDAATGVAQVLAGVSARPTVNLVLKVTPQSFVNESCAVLETIAGMKKALVLPGGTAFKFPDAFNLAPDSLVEVFAYTDLAPSCGADTLEVISLSLFAIPAVSSGDADGDLLADPWECLFLAFDPNGDNDGDNISNLQEFFDGTDPMNAASAGDPADLTPPQIIITTGNGGTVNLNWAWPEQYVGKVKFDLHSTDALGQPFTLAPDLIQYLGGGNYQLTLPNNGAVKFFRLQLSLK